MELKQQLEVCYCAGEQYRQTIQSLVQVGFLVRNSIGDDETVMIWPPQVLVLRIKAKVHAIPTALQLVVDDLKIFRDDLASHLYTAVRVYAIRLRDMTHSIEI